jgi:serine/threonine protein kinase
MPTVSSCPELQTLARCLLGELSAPELEQMAQHLRECPRCLATVQALKGGNTLAAGKRPQPNSLTAASAEEFVQSLLDDLHFRKMAMPAPTKEIQSLSTPEVVDLSAPKKYPFLGLPQEAGELGRLGPYRILKPLGAGGMGLVFQAEDIQLKRPVALKVMQPSYSQDNEARVRFLREARAVAAIEHEHIVTIYQVGEDRGLPFLAMQFLRGETLEDRLRRERQLPIDEVLRIGREIAAGLAAAHERGLIHRDIKPANIWLEAGSGRVKILDFGLARAADDAHLTRTGTVMGTPEYMSPEQARGKGAEARSDLFSLGCVLYDMCAGQSPFQAQETMAVLLAVAAKTPRALTELNPKVPELLVILIMRLLAKHPDDRPASAAQVVEAFRRIEGHGQDPSGGSRYQRASRNKRSPMLSFVAVTLLSTLCFVGIWYGKDLIRFAKDAIAKIQNQSPGGR